MATLQSSKYSGKAVVFVLLLTLLSCAAWAAEAAAGQGGAEVPQGAAPAGPALETGAPQAETPGAGANAGEEAAEGITLSLSDAIFKALKNNLDVRVVGFEPRITAMEIDRQQSAFDPVASASLTYDSLTPPYTTTARTDSVVGVPGVTNTTVRTKTDAEVTAAAAGVSVKSTLGGTFSVEATQQKNDVVTRISANDAGTVAKTLTVEDDYSSGVTFGFVQPLLKNAGTGVNTTNVRVAQNNTRVSTYQFEDQIMNLVLNVEAAYWNLVLSLENLKVMEKSLQAAQDLLRKNLAEKEAGVLPPIEVTRARARVADRNAAIVAAQASIRDAEDDLRKILDSPDFAYLSTQSIRPTDAPSVNPQELDLASAVHTALARRPDIRQQVVILESLGLQVVRAKNQLLPEVDLQATYRINQFGDSWGDGFNTLDRSDLSAGIVLSLPLGNRLARSQSARARYQKLQGLVSLESLERTVTLAVKKAVRDVKTNLEQIDANRLRKQYAQENLEVEVQKYEVGQNISLDVLDAQDALQQAESAYIQSIIGFNIAMVRYYRATGEILEKKGIEVLPLAVIKTDSQAVSQ